MTDASPRALLRHRTDPSHRALEAVPALAALADPCLGEAVLARALAALHRGLSGLEPALERARAAGIDPVLGALDPSLDGVARITEDLAWLGRPVPAPRPATPDMLTRIGPGTLWVLWGAHLGNQVTLRHVARVMGEETAARLRYVATSDQDKIRFRALIAALEANAWPARAEAWCDQAEAAFDWLRRQAIAED